MKTVKGMPITGTNTAMSSTPPVKTTPNTSRDAERLVRQPAMPFQNKSNIKNLPVGTKPAPKVFKHTSPSAKALPSGAPVGQRKAIDQSGQVFGRMGTSHPKQKGSFFPAKFKTHRNAKFFGE